MFYRFVLTFLLLLSLAAPVAAQTPRMDRWSVTPGEAKVCTGATGGSCVTLTCGADGKLVFRVNAGGLQPGNGTMAVDGRLIGQGRFAGSRGFGSVLLDPRSNASILAALKSGNRLRVTLPGAAVDVSLGGSSAAINALVQTCSGAGPAVPVPVETNWTGGLRRADELTVQLQDIAGYDHSNKTRDMDIWGGDIRTGLQDPLLRGIRQEACERLCIATAGCRAYTWNKADGEVCFLKSGPGRMARYGGATSGLLKIPNEQHLLPPTAGPLPVIDEAVIWRAGDTAQAHAARVRALSGAQAGTCAAERAAAQALADDLEVSLPDGPFQAGAPLDLRWTGNRLAARIPIWIIASSKDPFRAAGAGAMMLGPEAPNPFGIAHGQGETRAMVSLWTRGAPEAGTVPLRPLQAGPFRVRLAVVAYLRACDEEVTLWQQADRVQVAPAPARLVVGTPLSRADLTHSLDVPALNRRVSAGKARFRITALTDGAEVVERAGSGARLSPTGRFLTVGHDGRIEVIDLIDGATVARITSASETFFWGAGDSVVVGSTAPWAAVDMAFPFAERLLFERQTTGPSCCWISPEATHVSVDLHNGVAVLRGSAGFAMAAIQGNPLLRELSGNAYGASRGWSAPLQAIHMRSLGLVAPIPVAVGYNIPGGSQGMGPMIVETGQPITRQGAEDRIEIASIFRSAGGAVSGEVGAFERIGLTLAPSIAAEDLLTPAERGYEEADTLQQRGAMRKAAWQAALTRVGARAGWRFDLVDTPGNNYNTSNCFDFLGDPETLVNGHPVPGELTPDPGQDMTAPGHLGLPGDEMSQILRLPLADRDILIGRVECTSGATGGTLRGISGLFVLELRPGRQPLVMQTELVNASSYMANERVPQFQDHAIQARLYDRHLLVYTPGAGGIALIDLDRDIGGEPMRLLTGLPSGDLLTDAFLTEDRQSIVQMNSDGSFHLWRVANGENLLSGRIVEDEIALWNPAFQFDATAEAASLIDLRFPGLDAQFSLDRFGAQLFVDDLMTRTMAGDVPAAPQLAIPPDLSGSIRAAGDRIRLQFTVSRDRAAQVVELFQDGALTDWIELTPGQYDYEVTTLRLPGTRYAALVARSEAGLASQALVEDLGSTQPGGTNRALAVAVDLYADDGLGNLNYAKADADRVMRALSTLPEGAPGYERPVFVGGRRADPGDVLTALDRALDGLGADGHLTLFFAGHGLQGADGQYYLAMHKTRLDDLPGTALRFDDIAERLRDTQARVTILIDACHSGEAGNGLFATNDGALSGLSGLPQNVTILAASKGRQFSIEADALQGGLFSVALERVLTSERAAHDANGNGRIEASELAEGLRRIVSGQSEGRQVPWMTKGRIVGDHALY